MRFCELASYLLILIVTLYRLAVVALIVIVILQHVPLVVLVLIIPLKAHTLLPPKLAQLCSVKFQFSADMLLDMQLPLELVFFHVCKSSHTVHIFHISVMNDRVRTTHARSHFIRSAQ